MFVRLDIISDELNDRLDQLTGLVGTLTEQENLVMIDLTHLTDAVTENTSVDESAVALLNQLSQLIRDNSTDPVALESLANQLDAESANLAAAVSANTPAAPASPPGDTGGSPSPEEPPASE